MNRKGKQMYKVKGYHRSVRGIAYTEVLLSSIILAVLVVSAVKLFANLGRSQQNTVGQKTVSNLASQMIEEIKVLPYVDPVDINEDGPGVDELGSDRSAFDDIDDYDEWSAQPPQDKQGNPLDQYPDLIRSVQVFNVSAADFNQQISDDEGYKKVIVKISRDEVDNVIFQQNYIFADAFAEASSSAPSGSPSPPETTEIPETPETTTTTSETKKTTPDVYIPTDLRLR